ncbi:MAG: hypothetical protein HC858_09795 [Brachymonas sp.]|nr:hypothetical protein [Brachymonas sp.]
MLAKLSIFKDIASKQRAQEQAKPPIVTQVATPTNLSTPAQGSAPLHAQLTLLAAQIAKDTGKTVNLAVDLQALSQWLIPHQQALKDIVIQLLRNAVVHGIEASTQRLQAGKSASGNIRIQLKSSDGQWQLSVHDDGAGLNLARLRERLIQLAWYTPEQVQSMDDRQVIAHIFKAGFSTASAPSGQADASSHAGRGVGLDVVQAQAKSIGAALGLSFIPGQFTEFKLRLAQGVAV